MVSGRGPDRIQGCWIERRSTDARTPPWNGCPTQLARHQSPTIQAWHGGGRTSIGIGGHLAVPPLPHHRAYGSVPRRFGGLSGSHLLQGEQPHLLEAGLGEGAVEGAGGTEPPRPLGAEDGRTGRLLPHAETSQLLIAPAPRLPLDPGDAAKAAPDPAIQGLQL